MSEAVGFLETTGLTPAMVAIDCMAKTAGVQIPQVELNDLCGVCVKVTGSTADVQEALAVGHRIAESLHAHPVSRVIPRPAPSAGPALQSPREFNPLIQQDVVLGNPWPPANPETTRTPHSSLTNPMNPSPHPESPAALGFLETQGFTAVFEAIDTACKAAEVEVVGKEKLGGGYITVVVRGELSAVTAAVDAGRAKVEGLGKLIAAHVVARPSPAVLRLLPKL